MKEYSKLIDVKTFANEYNIGINKAYQFVNAKGFPKIKVGKRILIIRSKIDEFIEASVGKEF